MDWILFWKWVLFIVLDIVALIIGLIIYRWIEYESSKPVGYKPDLYSRETHYSSPKRRRNKR